MNEINQDIKNELNEINHLILTAQENFKLYDYLTTKKETLEENIIIHRNLFFKFCIQNQLELTILNLTKLFHDKGDYNIRGFINKFESKNVFESADISHSIIKKWRIEISNSNNEIKEIAKIRNNFIAHRLKDREKDTPKVTKAILRKLITIAQKIVKEIYWELWQDDYRIERPIIQPVEDLTEIVKELADFRRKELLPFEKALKGLEK